MQLSTLRLCKTYKYKQQQVLIKFNKMEQQLIAFVSLKTSHDNEIAKINILYINNCMSTKQKTIKFYSPLRSNKFGDGEEEDNMVFTAVEHARNINEIRRCLNGCKIVICFEKKTLNFINAIVDPNSPIELILQA